mgnify:CR=1 FL=1
MADYAALREAEDLVKLADDIARFAAATLFKTSDLGSPADQKKERQALFAHNAALCKITGWNGTWNPMVANAAAPVQIDKTAESIREIDRELRATFEGAFALRSGTEPVQLVPTRLVLEGRE